MNAHCPGCHCRIPDDERPPQPAASSPGIRRLALDATTAAIRAAKDSRKKPATTEEQDR